MKHQPIRTGLLSFGMSGRIFHAPFLHSHAGFIFNAVAERHTKKVNQFYPNVVSYDSAEALIQDPALELIVVNTPNDTHFEYARESLLAGKHILIEKPFATSVRQANELFKLADKLELKAMPYQNRRWDSDFQSVKQIVDSGRLGNLLEAHFRFDRYRPAIEAKAFKEEPIPGSGLAFNLGPHLLDQVISLFGKPLRCYKTTARNREDSKVDDYAFFHFIYPDNLNVFVHASLLVPRPLPAFVLHGTRGTYVKDRTDIQEKQLDAGVSPLDVTFGLEPAGGEGELTLVDEQGNKKVELLSSPRGNYRGVYDAVYRHVREDAPFPVRAEEILLQMEILEMEDA